MDTVVQHRRRTRPTTVVLLWYKLNHEFSMMSDISRHHTMSLSRRYSQVQRMLLCSIYMPMFTLCVFVCCLPRLRRWHITSQALMVRFRAAPLLVLPFGLLLFRSLPASGQATTITGEEACSDLRTGKYPGSAWTFDDCVDVWERYARTVPPGLQRRLPHVDKWKQAASELRRVGSPCLVASDPTSDGAGSSTVRHIATWIFAEEMGCDWVSQTGVKST